MLKTVVLLRVLKNITDPKFLPGTVQQWPKVMSGHLQTLFKYF